jgi:hypothetical protein
MDYLARLAHLQAVAESKAAVTVKLDYYPGAHWGCEIRTLDGRFVASDQFCSWAQAIEHAIELLRQQKPGERL